MCVRVRYSATWRTRNSRSLKRWWLRWAGSTKRSTNSRCSWTITMTTSNWIIIVQSSGRPLLWQICFGMIIRWMWSFCRLWKGFRELIISRLWILWLGNLVWQIYWRGWRRCIRRITTFFPSLGSSPTKSWSSSQTCWRIKNFMGRKDNNRRWCT